MIKRICGDRALTDDELVTEILNISPDKQIVICGDGADLFYKSVSDMDNIKKAPEHLKFQSAVGVGMFAYRNIDNICTVDSENLLPVYLRLPQAERELKAKKETQK